MSKSDAADRDADESVIERARSSFDRLENRLGDADSLEELTETELEAVLDDVDQLAEVVTEVESVLETADLSSLPEAVDGEELLAAIDVTSVPEAVDRGEIEEAVDARTLVEAIDLTNAWDATDFAALWKETRELEDAVDGVTADDSGAAEGGDASLIESGAEAVADEATDVVSDAADESLGDVAADDLVDVPDIEADPEAYQVFIQELAIDRIDAVREGLLVAHETFERLVEYNRERFGPQDGTTHSRNPTAVSTLEVERSALEGGTRHSTVPQQVRHSTAPSRTRIYGHRFETEREKLRGNDE